MRRIAVLVLLASTLHATPASAGPCPTSWTIPTMPVISTPHLKAVLTSVSAASPTSVWAVGSLTDTTNRFRPLTEYWNGLRWQLGAPRDAAAGGDTWLNDVVAFPAGGGKPAEAWAVGYAGPRVGSDRSMILQRWSGPNSAAPWQVTAPSGPAGAATELLAIDGANRGELWAVGWARSDGYRPLIQRFTGGAWTSVVSAPRDAGSLEAALVSVAARAPNDVWAVGYERRSSGFRPLVERFDGTSWSVVPVPAIADHDEAVFVDVLAIGANDIWAVGYRSAGTVRRTLAMHFDGSSWSVAQTPDPGPVDDALRSVSVLPLTGQVWAAGHSLSATGDASPVSVASPPGGQSAWTVVTPATNGGVVGDEFLGIDAAPGSGQLWAAGSVGREPLIETVCPSTTPSGLRAPAAPAVPAVPALPSSRPGELPTTDAGPGEPPVRSVPPAPRTASGGSPTIARDVAGSALPGIVQTDTFGAAVADFSRPGGGPPDGLIDFQLGRHGDPLQLWVNKGDGTWQQVGVGQFPAVDRHGCAWGDVVTPSAKGADGLPDLLCTIGAEKGSGIKTNELWAQRPDGSFARSAEQPGTIDVFGRGRTATFFYAGDPTAPGPHRPSLFVGNEAQRTDGVPTPNRFLLNVDGELRHFPAAGLDLELGASCVEPSDYDGDGRIDILVCTTFGGGLALYRNIGSTGAGGGPAFVETTATAGLLQGGVVSGHFVDLDVDGCEDVVEVFRGSLVVLLQRRSAGTCAGAFERVWGRALKAGRAVASGDVDHDGMPDLYVLQEGAEPDRMLINDGTGRSFSSVPVPPASGGAGESVWSVSNAVTGLTDFLVLNGANVAGPVQLIRFFDNPTPSPIQITSAPEQVSSSTSASFSFTSISGSGFVCSLDGRDPEPCLSGVRYDGLDAGTHRFAVWAVASGSVLAQATASFAVVTPTVSTTPPSAPAGSTVLFTGVGFVPHERLEASFGSTAVTSVDADEDGAFAVPVTVPTYGPDGWAGSHPLAVVDPVLPISASSTFEISAQWPQFRSDAARSGTNAFESVIGPGEVAGLAASWPSPVPSCSVASCPPAAGVPFVPSPVVSGSTVYVASGDGMAYAFDSSTGSSHPGWPIRVGSTTCGGKPCGVSATPAVDGGIAYVGSLDGLVYAFDATTGAPQPGWPVSVKASCSPGGTCPALVASPLLVDGTVVAMAVDGTAIAIDPLTGAVRWRSAPPSVGQQAGSSPAAASGVVFVVRGSATNATVFALDLATGATRWQARVGEPVTASPATANGLVFIATRAGTVVAYEAATGERAWSRSGPSGFSAIASPATATVGGRPELFVATTDATRSNANALLVLDQATGAFRWRTTPIAAMTASPAVANGVVYTAAQDGRIRAYGAAGCAATTCGPLWTSPALGGDVVASPAVSSAVFVVDGNGLVSAYSPDPGTGS